MKRLLITIAIVLCFMIGHSLVSAYGPGRGEGFFGPPISGGGSGSGSYLTFGSDNLTFGSDKLTF